jgi:hypothetical protein
MDILSSVIKYSKKIFVYTSRVQEACQRSDFPMVADSGNFITYNSTSQAEVMNNPDVEHVNAQLPLACP